MSATKKISFSFKGIFFDHGFLAIFFFFFFLLNVLTKKKGVSEITLILRMLEDE